MIDEDIVIVHHQDLGPVAGDRRRLATLLERGRVTHPVDLLAGEQPPEIELVVIHADGPTTQLQACTMRWLSPKVTHISSADPQFARQVIHGIETLRAKKAGIELAPAAPITQRPCHCGLAALAQREQEGAVHLQAVRCDRRDQCVERFGPQAVPRAA